GVREIEFTKVGANIVLGVMATDGQRLVVKILPPGTNTPYLRALQDVQIHLAVQGYPAPKPLLDPQPFRVGVATVESRLPEPRPPRPRQRPPPPPPGAPWPRASPHSCASARRWPVTPSSRAAARCARPHRDRCSRPRRGRPSTSPPRRSGPNGSRRSESGRAR